MIEGKRSTYQTVSEGTSKQRTRDGCNTVHTTNETNVRRPLLERGTMSQNEEGARKYTGRTKSSNRAPKYQSGRIWSSTANQAAKLENTNCGQENPFDSPKLVELAEEKL